MKRKTYEKPTAQVVQLEQQCHILAGSDTVVGVQDYNWNDVVEEAPIMNLDDYFDE